MTTESYFNTCEELIQELDQFKDEETFVDWTKNVIVYINVESHRIYV